MSEKLEPLGKNSVIRDSFETTELSPEQGAEILYWSFFYSQGNKDLQMQIFAYIARKHPEWKISPQEEVSLRKLTKERVSKFFQHGIHEEQGDFSITDESDARCTEFLTALNEGVLRRVEPDIPELIIQPSVRTYTTKELLVKLIDRDYKYLNVGRPLPKGAKEDAVRPFMSHFVNYILAGERVPGPQVYSEMVEDLQREYTEYKTNPMREDDPARRDIEIRELVDAYNSQNPDKRVTP